MTRHPPVATLLLLLVCLPSTASAQREGPPTEAGVMIGASRYDLTGTGTGFSLNAGITIPLARRMVLLEPSIGFVSIKSQFGDRTTWMFPELTVQLEQRLGRVRPYLGVGLGTGTRGLSGPAHWEFTMLALGGARVHVGGRWGVRGEVRLRAVDPFHSHTVGFGLGFTHASF